MLRRSVRRPGRALAALVVVLALVGCSSGGDGRPDALGDDGDGPNRETPPTLPGGVELPRVEMARALVGSDLTYGTPLPSEQLAADGFREDPEVVEVVARRVYLLPEGRHVADLVVLRIDGAAVFDDAALTAFEHAAIAGLAGVEDPPEEVPLAGRTVGSASGEVQSALGFREGDLVVLLSGPNPLDLTGVAARQLEAIARGAAGPTAPTTPLPGTPAEAAFVTVPSVTFAPIPPPEEEPVAPVPPELFGATSVTGRYGVVAGERRTVVWVITVDPATYPSAEVLDGALPGLVASRAEGTPPEPSEVIDRVVLSSTNEPGLPSARVFRHRSLVVIVEGDRPDQVDAVVTAWIAVLAGVAG